METIDRFAELSARPGGSASGAPVSVHFSGAPPGATAAGTEPAAVGVDLGSGYTRIWAAGRPTLHVPTISDSLTNPTPLIRRGRITDVAGLHNLLSRLHRYHHRPIPTGAILVVCHPVLATPDDEHTARRLLTDVFAPSQVLSIATVRAAAIGAGAAPGPRIIADVGAHLTEVALLDGGRVAAARRADLGMNDLIRPTATEPIVRTIADLVGELRHEAYDDDRAAAAAIRTGLLLVGGGAAQPGLAAQTAAALNTAVRPAAHPRLAAARGAGLAALAALRRTAATIG
jgi:rod shape-determining protein MreB and related proteins